MNLARHYRTLGLRRGASSDDVKRAYRQLVRQYHPDINPDAEAIEHFIEINDAYTAVLEEIEAAAARKSNRRGIALDSLNSIRHQLEKLGLANSDGTEGAAARVEEGAAEFVQRELIQTGFGEPGFAQEPLAEVFAGANVEVSAGEVAIANERISAHQAAEQTAYRPVQTAPKLPKPLTAEEETLKREAYDQLKRLLSQQKFPLAIALVEGLAHRMPADLEISQWQAIVYQRWGRMLILQGQPQKARIYLKKALRTDPNNPSLWSEVNRDFWHLSSLNQQPHPAV